MRQAVQVRVKGEHIRSLREERGYNLVEFAEKAGISPSYLSELERGAKRPSLKTLDKIASVLYVPREAIVEISLEGPGLGFGDRVRFAREKKGMTISTLAKEVQLSAAYLAEIEKNKTMPAVSTIKKLAQVLGVPETVLLAENSALGLKLKLIREEQGLTQAALAEKATVSPGLIAQIEQGKVQPSFKSIEKIAGVLGVSPCFFVLDNENLEAILPAFSPELRELLQQPNVQAVLRVICHMNEKELQFVLNFIKLFKQAGLPDYQ